MSGKTLPVIVTPPGARFTCHRCGDCCRYFPIQLTPTERARYEARDWSSILPGSSGPVFDDVTVELGKTAPFLRRRDDGACVFLGEDNLCRIHAKLGEAEKPLVCRLFPFTVVPGDEDDERPRIGCHFVCKGLAAGDGAPVDAGALAGLVEELSAVQSTAPARERVPWEEGRSYGRSELELVFELVTTEIQDAGSRPFPDRILAVAKFVDLFSKSNYADVRDPKRREIVATFARGVREQVKKGILRPKDAPPSFAERLLFRQILGMSVRRDPVDLIRRGALRRASRSISGFLSGLAFSAGGGIFAPTGRDRRVRVGDVRRFAPEADPASPEADGALTRYFVAHLASRRVLDAVFKPREALAAFGLLLRQYPAILFFARAACFAREGDAVDRTDYACALRTADWTFGHVPWTRGLAGSAWRTLLHDLDAPFQHLAWAARRPG